MTDMTELLNSALACWGLQGCPVKLIAARENHVYRVDTSDGPRALRLHRPGLRSQVELRSELDWMAGLVDAGMSLPRPFPDRHGRLLPVIETRYASLLDWVDGRPMGRDGKLDPEMGPAEFRQLGTVMAKLHRLSDDWTPPAGFRRHSWDIDGLTGEAPLWGRFWESPLLSSETSELLREARRFARDRLASADSADFGLVHADLVPENVMIGKNGPILIDFDDGGYGYRLFDLATTLNRCGQAENVDRVEAALLDGYLAERELDLTLLPLFRTLRAFSYVGWVSDRMEEAGAAARSERHVAVAKRMAHKLLAI